MLGRLHIENIAVIEKADVELSRGLNCLTGETGAGKSILIDSINAVIGQRTSKELVRTGAKAAYVSAEFYDIGGTALSELAKLEIEPEEGLLILGREIKADGRSSFRINGRPVTASVLREAGRLLINIHGQHDNQTLLDPSRHYAYLDAMIPDRSIPESFIKCWREYSDARQAFARNDIDEAEKERRIDLLKYQIESISSAELSEGEYDELRQRRETCRNAERLKELLRNASILLSGGDELEGICSRTREAAEQLGETSEYIEGAKELYSRLNDAAYELEDIACETDKLIESLDFDADELEAIETRIDILRRMIKKYGSEKAALEYMENARGELEQIEVSDERREQLRKQCIKYKHETIDAAARLSAARKEAAGDFCRRISEELAFLDMPSVRFEVSLTKKDINERGGEDVEFLISTNPGEPPKPLSRIASGGELSRIMLAVKNVLADKDGIDTLIFDEVDTGVSGRAAHKIGLKLKQAARGRQIICITHLAQIAANADTHMLIKKEVRDGRTYTRVLPLGFDQRVSELARINAGESVTEAQLATARELLANAGITPETDGNF